MRNDQTRELCPEHNVYIPCSGCRADELVSTGRRTNDAPTTDIRKRAAGDDDE